MTGHRPPSTRAQCARGSPFGAAVLTFVKNKMLDIGTDVRGHSCIRLLGLAESERAQRRQAKGAWADNGIQSAMKVLSVNTLATERFPRLGNHLLAAGIGMCGTWLKPLSSSF